MDPVEYNTIQGVRGGIAAAKTRDGEIRVSPARTEEGFLEQVTFEL